MDVSTQQGGATVISTVEPSAGTADGSKVIVRTPSKVQLPV